MSAVARRLARGAGAAACLGVASALALAVASVADEGSGSGASVPPVNVTAPKISGTAREGQTLAADRGGFTGTEPIGYAFQWRRCDLTKLICKSIAGATGQTYTLTAADVGATIRVRATATNGAGSVTAPSMATAPVTQRCPSFAAAQQAGIAKFPEASELSGLASGRRNPGVLFAHNDSGDTERVLAMDAAGAHLGTYPISANRQSDWEDMAVGPGPVAGTSYLYLGSIGANGGRHWLYAYRAPEPAVSRSQAPISAPLESVVKLRMRYPGSEEHNAEALMVDPHNHDIYVVTKKWNGVAKVFRYPAADQDPVKTYELQLVATLRLPGPPTAGDISADGREIAIKGYGYSHLWPRAPGQPVGSALAEQSCRIPHGPGETIAFTADGAGYFTIAEGRWQPLNWFSRR